MKWRYLPSLAVGLGALALLAYGLSRDAGPEDIALEYARSLYADDAAGAYGLLSAQDRRVKDEATFLRERNHPTGFSLELARQFASFIEATPVKKTPDRGLVTVTLKLRLPDANAPQIAALVQGWDERRLNSLARAERRRIMKELNWLHRARALPTLEGEETFELVREGSGWRVFLNLAGGVRIRFEATVEEAIPLQVTVSPEEVLARPGERVQVSIHVKKPKLQAEFLAMLQCPMLLPVSLAPGQVEEFRSEYLVLKEIPEGAKRFRVTYQFARAR
jgi:hypothetical protein